MSRRLSDEQFHRIEQFSGPFEQHRVAAIDLNESSVIDRTKKQMALPRFSELVKGTRDDQRWSDDPRGGICKVDACEVDACEINVCGINAEAPLHQCGNIDVLDPVIPHLGCGPPSSRTHKYQLRSVQRSVSELF